MNINIKEAVSSLPQSPGFGYPLESNGEKMKNGLIRPSGILTAFVLAVMLGSAGSVSAQDTPEMAPEVVDFVEQLGKTIPGDITFRDEDGNLVDMATFIDKPTILNFVYYRCPGICSPLMDGLSNAIDGACSRSQQKAIVGKPPNQTTLNPRNPEGL